MMSVIGLSIGEVAALLGIISLLFAAVMKFYTAFRTHISAPLIEAIDKLRVEISQLERYLLTEYQGLIKVVEELSERMTEFERRG